jgi:hypothetical protein
MAKSSEFTAVGIVYNIIKRRGNADHIISDETKKGGKTAIAATTREGRAAIAYAPANKNVASARSIVERRFFLCA